MNKMMQEQESKQQAFDQATLMLKNAHFVIRQSCFLDMRRLNTEVADLDVQTKRSLFLQTTFMIADCLRHAKTCFSPLAFESVTMACLCIKRICGGEDPIGVPIL